MTHLNPKKTILKNNLQYCLLATAGLILMAFSAQAQSNIKESSNNFALYTQTGEIKHLETAKKFIDAAYKTKRDSSNTRNNVMRAMIYSSMAYADSTRTIKNDQDPIEITQRALSRLKTRDLEAHENEISYINQNLAASYTFLANKALTSGQYEESYRLFLKVRDLQPQNNDIIYNLGLLAKYTNKLDEAVRYYQELLELESNQPIQYLELAEIQENQGKPNDARATLEKGRQVFPQNKDILFNLIKAYVQIENYSAITPIIDEAVKQEPENVELNYLAGFAHENQGNRTAAKHYYEKTVNLDKNNYEANLALGLLYLKDFLEDNDDQEAQYNAQNFLLKANEIKPHEVNALKSLALYYQSSDDILQLDRVNMLLNRLVN